MINSGFVRYSIFAIALAGQVLLRAESLPGFTLTSEQWTYDAEDGGAIISGILVAPSTNSLKSAILISHGRGGSATSFALEKARVMTNWGAVCIGPNYTHATNANSPDNEGYSPENSRRARACLTILASLGCVNTNRIAAYGNSLGAFLTVGFSGETGHCLRIAAITAGGTSGTTNTSLPAPAVQEVESVITPLLLLLQGTDDTTVPPDRSAMLQSLLNSNAVPNSRVLFEGIGHDLHNNPATRDTVYQLIRDWFTAWGLFGPTNPSPVLTATVAGEGAAKLSWNRAAAVTTIEWTSNLAAGFHPAASVTNRFAWEESEPAPAAFYRIRQAD